MKIPKRLIADFRKEQVFLLTTHISPDGDAIGSCLALDEALRLLARPSLSMTGIRAGIYRFMPGYRTFSQPRDILSKNPLVVLLDCNSPNGCLGRTCISENHCH